MHIVNRLSPNTWARLGIVLILTFALRGLGSVTTAAAASGGPDGGGYTYKDAPSANPVDMTGSSPVAVYDGQTVGPLPIGFDFTFYGTAYQNFYICDNGVMQFTAAPHCDPLAEAIPGTAPLGPEHPYPIIAAWWGDLDPSDPSSYVRYLTIGTAPNRTLVMAFINVVHHVGGGAPVDFQIQLHETSNDIDVVYQNAPAYNGIDHSAGIQGTDTIGLQYYIGANGLSTPLTVTYQHDTTAPETTIETSPAVYSSTASPTFSFSGNDGSGSGVVGYQCQMDSDASSACNSGSVSYSGLSEGTHTFAVYAVDQAGNADLSPATYSWTIDTSAPDTSISSQPAALTNSTSPSFSFSGDDGSGSGVGSYECKLDAGAYSACSSPKNYSGQSDGSHSFSVRAVDKAGNKDASPATYTWTIDATAPTTSITGGQPANPTTTASASFSFSGSDANGVASYECDLDGGGYNTCSSPQDYPSLADGLHTFSVRAIDNAGNTDATPAVHTWRVDTIAPDTSISTYPTNPSNTASPSFSFSGSDPGGSGVASFECKLDTGSFSPCTSPQDFSGLADGTHTFSVRAIDNAVSADTSPASYSWTIDATAPTTSIDGGEPANPTVVSSASFTFSGDDGSGVGGVTFECKLDLGSYGTCSSPQAYSSLGDGSHTFSVRASDALGNTNATPATYTWTVDATAPQTSINSLPAGFSNVTGPSFSFSGDDGSGVGGFTFECQLDTGSFDACTSPQSYSGLSDGAHTFSVRASDSLGNTDASPATYTWTIDATVPETSLDSGQPANPTTLSSASFGFSGTDANAISFECDLDGGGYSSCTSPKTYNSLADGVHTFSVRAVDAAGNIDAIPASYSWRVDTTAPDTDITASPTNPTNLTSASFSFSGTDTGGSGVASFECKLDTGSFSICTSPQDFSGLADGTHTFAVRAIDGAGNADTIPASYTWVINTQAPSVPVLSAPSNGKVVTGTAVTLQWNASTGATGYRIILDNGAAQDLGNMLTLDLSSLALGGHTWKVAAYDGLGNLSAYSTTFSFTVVVPQAYLPLISR